MHNSSTVYELIKYFFKGINIIANFVSNEKIWNSRFAFTLWLCTQMACRTDVSSGPGHYRSHYCRIWAKIGQSDKLHAIQQLSNLSRKAEQDFIANDNFDALIEQERQHSWKYGGKTVFGDAKPPNEIQLRLF